MNEVNEYSSEMVSTSPTYKESIKWLLDNKRALDELEHRLCGEELILKTFRETDEETGEIVEKQEWRWERTGEPYMSKEGAATVVTYLRSFLEKAIILSCRTERDIMTAMRRIHGDLTNLLYVNMKRWNVNPTKASTIVTMCTQLAYSCLMRALNGGERKLLGETVEHKEVIKKDEEEKKGILPF